MAVKLFEPFTIRNVTLPNRIVMSPMCMYSSSNRDGFVQNWHLVHYASRAAGKTGTIIVEATAVSPEGRISEHDLGIWDDKHIDGLKKLVDLMKEQGAVTGIQLAHAGRKAQVEEEIVAPSAIRYNEKYKVPRALETKEVKNIVRAFKEAAARAKAAGFDIIELHAAHGYLLNEFLSPLTNERTDMYGGSPENRYRLLKEVIDAVREVWQGPLFVRISAADYHNGGLNVNDYVTICRRMKEQGVDLIDVSSGGVISGVRIQTYPGYQVKYAEKIRSEVQIPVSGVGLITSPLHAEEILQNNRADLIFLGRELLRNPYWPYTAAKQLGYKIEPPVQYRLGWR